MITTFLSILFVVICLFLILFILLQPGKGGSIASTFGAATSQQVFGGRGASSLLEKLTIGFTICFMVLALLLSYLGSRSGDVNILKERAAEQQRRAAQEQARQQIEQQAAEKRKADESKQLQSVPTDSSPSDSVASPEKPAPVSLAPTSPSGTGEPSPVVAPQVAPGTTPSTPAPKDKAATSGTDVSTATPDSATLGSSAGTPSQIPSVPAQKP